MTTLTDLTSKISNIIQDSSVTDITSRINGCISMIAGGVRLPNGQISPPLPELYSTDTVTTATDAAYVSLPATYQRNVFMIADDSGDRLYPPSGGDYYSFMLFLNRLSEKDLSETGSIYRVVIKGRNIYYQGIPTAEEDLTLHFYRKPVDITDGDEEPDGIPDHLQERLIKHYVCGNVFGEAIEDGMTSQKMGYEYHMSRFYEAMTDLVDFIGIDEEASYYGSDLGFVDRGVCD